jgi:hypothetical protein
MNMIVNLGRTGSLALWLAVLACAWAPHAQAAEQWPNGLSHEFFTAELATTLDADNQTDWIRAYSCTGPAGGAASCLRVEVSETGSTQTILLNTAAKGVRITSHDVDGDHLPDVLVFSAEDGRPLGVWINDGHGGFKESDVRSYPASVWHEDPLLCRTPSPEYIPLASTNGVQDFCLDPCLLKTPRLDSGRSLGDLEVAAPHSARLDGHSGRAPPTL